ncbi:hypothetical protein SteCoe_32585 [Stentor coeruleus]|uniref:CRAL-TRIO domain-containing protein n=1 Tax=Stentor coeruleus TaxID=5963 RepID=A0A1R2AYM9_9CILI|nr:hypothetical protein SteCoe_32585 [Stentor coeruleus]
MERDLESYQPAPIEIKEGVNRKIFMCVQLDPEEIKDQEIFRKYASDNSIPLPSWYIAYRVTGDQRYDLKFMCSMKRDVKKAIDMMNMYSSWLLTMPVLEDEVISYLRQGVIYPCGRSITYNPIIVVNVRKIIDSKMDLEALLRLNYFTLNWVIDNMLVPGKVESWYIIQDLKDVGLSSIPGNMMKTMSERLSVYFSLRLGKCFTINVPLAIKAFWNMTKIFIDKETRKKIFIQRKGWEKLLSQFITPENLERKYGGAQDNREGEFYPFRV